MTTSNDYPLIINAETRTIRPASPDHDDYYGLAVGTNGTAATMRRTVAELEVSSTAPQYTGLTWLRSNGKPATGLTLRPSDTSSDTWRSPWTGERAP